MSYDFTRAFAQNGQKADIADNVYKGGWVEVVGGINGIPTTQQFNFIMHEQESKTNALYQMIFNSLGSSDEIEKAFFEAFTKVDGSTGDSGDSGESGDTEEIIDETAMTSEDVDAAISTLWNGESTDDETAMSATDVQTAIDTQWNGESTDDETAMSATDVANAIK